MSFSLDSLAIDTLLHSVRLATPQQNQQTQKEIKHHDDAAEWTDWADSAVWGTFVGTMASPHPLALSYVASVASQFSAQKTKVPDMKTWLDSKELKASVWEGAGGMFWVPDLFKAAACEYVKGKLDSEGVVQFKNLRDLRICPDSYSPQEILQILLPDYRDLQFLEQSVVTRVFVQQIQEEAEEADSSVVDLYSIKDLASQDWKMIVRLLSYSDYTLIAGRYLLRKTMHEDLLSKLEPWIMQHADGIKSKRSDPKQIDAELPDQISSLVNDADLHEDVLDHLVHELTPPVREKVKQYASSVFLPSLVAINDTEGTAEQQQALADKIHTHLEALRSFPHELPLCAYFFDNFSKDLLSVYPQLKHSIEAMDVEAILKVLPSPSKQPDFKSLQASLEKDDAALLLHVTALLYFYKVTGKMLFASGKFVPVILKQLSSMAEEAQMQELLKAQKSILKSLKTPTDLTGTKNTIRTIATSLLDAISHLEAETIHTG